jgi:hypothetical protein
VLSTTPNGPLYQGVSILRYRYILLAYAARSEEDPSLPLAVACVAFEAPSRNCELFIKKDWEQHVSDSHRDYIEATFEDWVKVMESSSGELPPHILELSVGPIRTVGDGECDKEDLNTYIESFLTSVNRRFTLP